MAPNRLRANRPRHCSRAKRKKLPDGESVVESGTELSGDMRLSASLALWHRGVKLPIVTDAWPLHPQVVGAEWRTVVARANGARTSVRGKVGNRRTLEISKRRS